MEEKVYKGKTMRLFLEQPKLALQVEDCNSKFHPKLFQTFARFLLFHVYLQLIRISLNSKQNLADERLQVNRSQARPEIDFSWPRYSLKLQRFVK